MQSSFASASNKIPLLPKPRLIEAFASTPRAPDKKTPETSNLSACQISLTEHIAIAPIVAPIQETGDAAVMIWCGSSPLFFKTAHGWSTAVLFEVLLKTIESISIAAPGTPLSVENQG